jgi:hypothetical protein
MTVMATAPSLKLVGPLSLPVTDVVVPTLPAVKVNVNKVPPSPPVGAPDTVPPTSVAVVKSDAKLATSAVTVHVTVSALRTICALPSAPRQLTVEAEVGVPATTGKRVTILSLLPTAVFPATPPRQAPSTKRSCHRKASYQ